MSKKFLAHCVKDFFRRGVRRLRTSQRSNSTEIENSKFYEILKKKSTLMLYDRHTELQSEQKNRGKRIKKHRFISRELTMPAIPPFGTSGNNVPLEGHELN